MVNGMELYLMSFIEGYLGPEKAYKLRNNAYKWRFKDAWRYGVMHRLAKRELEASLKCECQKNELAKKYIETLIHPV